MELIKTGLIVMLIATAVAGQTEKRTEYKYGADSNRQPDVPQGAVTKHEWASNIFEGTTREYYIYVPAQYDPEQPAALMVFQDGHTYVKEDGDFRTPIVFDNLIHQKAMPVTIGLFVDPGHRGEERPESPWRNSNRREEYDTLSDKYALLLIEEIIPELQKSYNLSNDRKMRAICGISSGGICAFTAAWQHPEYFHKVLSHIGSFTGIQGGNQYPYIIRNEAKRDIKVFLQDGSNDLDNQFGNWWLSNLQIEAALKYRGYEYKFIGGYGEHNGRHGGAILPESLKWLWSDVIE